MHERPESESGPFLLGAIFHIIEDKRNVVRPDRIRLTKDRLEAHPSPPTSAQASAAAACSAAFLLFPLAGP